jgi:hypothetical protein
MNTCIYCGHKNEEAATFCAECSNQLETLEGVAPVDRKSSLSYH